MPDNGPSFCSSATHITRSSYHFLGHDFTFAEFVKTESEAGRRQVRTLSELHVRTSTQHLDIGTRLDLEIHYSEPGILKEFGFVPHEESLFMYTPSHVAVQTDSSPNPCMYFVATLWIAPGAQFDSVNIQTQSMAIFFHDGLTFEATSLAVDATGANSVAFPTGNSAETSIRSRRIVINSITGAVHGTYPLYDLLEIKTSSGAVGIDVDPKEVLPSHPQPATLYVSTMSGSIHAQTAFIATDARKSPTAIVPARDYRTTITSMSGRIDTNLVHGSETTLTSKSGSIDAVLSPYGDPSDKSHIVTAAETGSTTVTVLPSLSNPGQPLRKLYGLYKCKTGSLSINYPSEWEGTVQGTTVTGSINVHWPDLELGSGGGRRKIAWNSFKGVKGDGEGRLDFHTVTGSVTLNG